MIQNNVFRFLYSSSATVYGTPQSLPISENHITGLGCTNPYGKSKYFVEEILRDLCVSDQVSIIQCSLAFSKYTYGVLYYTVSI